jgi:hypothetical protein
MRKRRDLVASIAMLLLAFPAIPAFLIGSRLAKDRPAGPHVEVVLAIAMSLLSLPVWSIYVLLFAGDVSDECSTLTLCIGAGLVALSGLPAGVLFRKRRRFKWLSVMPIFLVSLFMGVGPFLLGFSVR